MLAKTVHGSCRSRPLAKKHRPSFCSTGQPQAVPMAGHQMGWCRACTVAMLCRAAPATLSPTHSSGRRIWFATVHNCSVHNAAPFPVHLDLDGTPARRYLPVLPWWRRQLMGPLRRIAVPCVVSSRTPRRYTRHAEPLACPATTAKNIGGLC